MDWITWTVIGVFLVACMAWALYWWKHGKRRPPRSDDDDGPDSRSIV